MALITTWRDRWGVFIVLVLAFWAGVVVGAVSMSPQAAPRPEQNQATTQSQSEDKSLATISDQLAAIAKAETAREQREADAQAHPWREAFAPASRSQWALVLAAVIASIAAVCTIGAIERQTNETARAAAISAQALEASSTAVIHIGRWTDEGHLILINIGESPARILQILVLLGASGSEIAQYRQTHDKLIAPNERIRIRKALIAPPTASTRVSGLVTYQDRRNGIHWISFIGHFRQLSDLQATEKGVWIPGQVRRGTYGLNDPPPPLDRPSFNAHYADSTKPREGQ